MTKKYQRTLSDIDFILSNINEELKNKIPIKLRNIIHENKLSEYNSEIDLNIPIEAQKLHPDTVDYLSMLYLNYWCENEEEKEILKQKFEENEIKNREKYRHENIFKKIEKAPLSNENIEENRNKELIEYKEPFFIKILNKIISIFKK